MPITLFPRPSVLAALVIAGSLACGVAVGASAAGALLLADQLRRA